MEREKRDTGKKKNIKKTRRKLIKDNKNGRNRNKPKERDEKSDCTR